ncbi:mCG147300 [Mus musculus]|nr:mCG147300 [Mus musculus]
MFFKSLESFELGNGMMLRRARGLPPHQPSQLLLSWVGCLV